MYFDKVAILQNKIIVCYNILLAFILCYQWIYRTYSAFVFR